MISIRQLTTADIPAADELRRIAGWNQTRDDWRRTLSLQPDGCFAAVHDHRVIGTVTTTRYGSALAWVGMMLVHPEFRGRGIGKSLMQHALEHLRNSGVSCVRLDATPAGRPLYEKLGFIAESTLTRWQCAIGLPRPASGQLSPQIRLMRDEDWSLVDEMDTAGIGEERSLLLRSLVANSHCALVWPNCGTVCGWGIIQPRFGADYIGPGSCTNSEGLLPLVTALLGKVEAQSIVWDIPDQNHAAVSVARRLDFQTVRPLTRMRLGEPVPAKDSATQFAIADPAWG